MTSLRFEPYPSNYYTHPGIDAALALRRKGLRAEDVQSAHLAVATPMLHTASSLGSTTLPTSWWPIRCGAR
jgi:2-methylcitrate dehydratase PrpD